MSCYNLVTDKKKSKRLIKTLIAGSLRYVMAC